MTQEQLNDTFFALAHPVRREILARLAKGEETVNELAAPFEMSLPAVSRHIAVLEKAGLISQSKSAQFRPCALNPGPLKDVATWAEQYRPIWEARFAQMETYLQQISESADDDRV